MLWWQRTRPVETRIAARLSVAPERNQADVRNSADPVVRIAETRLLDDSLRAGVWPDSVQVIGGKLSMRLPTG